MSHDPGAPLAFTNLCPHTRDLLVASGARGRRALARLLDMPTPRTGAHVGTARIATPCGTLRVARENHPNAPGVMRLSIALDMAMTPNGVGPSGVMLGLVNGEVHSHSGAVPDTVRAAAVGRPLSDLVETPAGFPGRDARILSVRCLSRSTRVLIWRAGPAADPPKPTLTLDGIAPPPARRRRAA